MDQTWNIQMVVDLPCGNQIIIASDQFYYRYSTGSMARLMLGSYVPRAQQDEINEALKARK